MPTTEAPAPPAPFDTTLNERERRLAQRLAIKYMRQGSPLLRSLLIFSALVGIGHAIEQAPLPGWAAFLLVYIPAAFLFMQYRRFNIFKSRLLCKLAIMAGVVEVSADGLPPAAPAHSEMSS